MLEVFLTEENSEIDEQDILDGIQEKLKPLEILMRKVEEMKTKSYIRIISGY